MIISINLLKSTEKKEYIIILYLYKDSEINCYYLFARVSATGNINGEVTIK